MLQKGRTSHFSENICLCSFSPRTVSLCLSMHSLSMGEGLRRKEKMQVRETGIQFRLGVFHVCSSSYVLVPLCTPCQAFKPLNSVFGPLLCFPWTCWHACIWTLDFRPLPLGFVCLLELSSLVLTLACHNIL